MTLEINSDNVNNQNNNMKPIVTLDITHHAMQNEEAIKEDLDCDYFQVCGVPVCFSPPKKVK